MKNIVLIGFMGTGKTTTGRLLSGRLNRSFIDLDQKIEQEHGLSVNEIFKIYGEPRFRQMEREAVAKVSRFTNMIIATGGGTVVSPDNRLRLMRNGIVISLTASVEAIIDRTENCTDRPLLNSRDDRRNAIANLLSQRDHLYKQADLVIDTSFYSPQNVSEKIIVFLRQGGYLRGRSFA